MQQHSRMPTVSSSSTCSPYNITHTLPRLIWVRWVDIVVHRAPLIKVILTTDLHKSMCLVSSPWPRWRATQTSPSSRRKTLTSTASATCMLRMPAKESTKQTTETKSKGRHLKLQPLDKTQVIQGPVDSIQVLTIDSRHRLSCQTFEPLVARKIVMQQPMFTRISTPATSQPW